MGGARVLVVDDEPAVLRAVQTNLARHEFQVSIAETGAQALVAIERERTRALSPSPPPVLVR